MKRSSVGSIWGSPALVILFVVLSYFCGCTAIDYAIYRSELSDVNKDERIPIRAIIDRKSDI